MKDEKIQVKTIQSENEVDRLEIGGLRSGSGSGGGSSSGGSGDDYSLNFFTISTQKNEVISSGNFKVSCSATLTARIARLTLNNSVFYALDSVTCNLVVDGLTNQIEEFDQSKNMIVTKEYKTEVSYRDDRTKQSVSFGNSDDIEFEPPITITKIGPDGIPSAGTLTAEGYFLVVKTPTPHIELFSMTYVFN